MKAKILTIALISLIMGLSLNSVAGNDDTIKANSVKNNSGFKASVNLYPDDLVKFCVEKPEQDKVKVRIYAEGNILLYTYLMKKHNSARVGFDLSTLEDGEYEFVIERNRKEVLRKTIEKQNKSI